MQQQQQQQQQRQQLYYTLNKHWANYSEPGILGGRWRGQEKKYKEQQQKSES